MIEQFERYHKALANRRRLMILCYLQKYGRRDVGDIAQAIRLSFKATSRHLAILLARDIVNREQKKTLMLYRIADPPHTLVQHTLQLLKFERI